MNRSHHDWRTLQCTADRAAGSKERGSETGLVFWIDSHTRRFAGWLSMFGFRGARNVGEDLEVQFAGFYACGRMRRFESFIEATVFGANAGFGMLTPCAPCLLHECSDLARLICQLRAVAPLASLQATPATSQVLNTKSYGWGSDSALRGGCTTTFLSRGELCCKATYMLCRGRKDCCTHRFGMLEI